MRRLLWRVWVFGAALAGGLVSGFPILSLGLVVTAYVILPLTLGFVALFSALGASWAGNLFPPHGDRTNLRRVMTSTAITTLFPGIPLLALLQVGPPAVFLGAAVLLLAVSASMATWRFRRPAGPVGDDVRLSAGLIALALLALAAGIGVAAAFGAVGP